MKVLVLSSCLPEGGRLWNQPNEPYLTRYLSFNLRVSKHIFVDSGRFDAHKSIFDGQNINLRLQMCLNPNWKSALCIPYGTFKVGGTRFESGARLWRQH